MERLHPVANLSGVVITAVRFTKLIALLLLSVAIGFLIALLRPRRVVSREDLPTPTGPISPGGGDLADVTR